MNHNAPTPAASADTVPSRNGKDKQIDSHEEQLLLMVQRLTKQVVTLQAEMTKKTSHERRQCECLEKQLLQANRQLKRTTKSLVASESRVRQLEQQQQQALEQHGVPPGVPILPQASHAPSSVGRQSEPESPGGGDLEHKRPDARSQHEPQRLVSPLRDQVVREKAARERTERELSRVQAELSASQEMWRLLQARLEKPPSTDTDVCDAPKAQSQNGPSQQPAKAKACTPATGEKADVDHAALSEQLLERTGQLQRDVQQANTQVDELTTRLAEVERERDEAVSFAEMLREQIAEAEQREDETTEHIEIVENALREMDDKRSEAAADAKEQGHRAEALQEQLREAMEVVALMERKLGDGQGAQTQAQPLEDGQGGQPQVQRSAHPQTPSSRPVGARAPLPGEPAMNESDAKVALGNVLKGFASRETALTQELERAVGQVQGRQRVIEEMQETHELTTTTVRALTEQLCNLLVELEAGTAADDAQGQQAVASAVLVSPTPSFAKRPSGGGRMRAMEPMEEGEDHDGARSALDLEAEEEGADAAQEMRV